MYCGLVNLLISSRLHVDMLTCLQYSIQTKASMQALTTVRPVYHKKKYSLCNVQCSNYVNKIATAAKAAPTHTVAGIIA